MTRLDRDDIERLRRSLDAPDLEGDRYAVGELLGRGGMGTVYLAHDRLLDRPVALKVLHVEDGSDAGVARMTREARTLARLEHPGIVPIHDLGRLADGLTTHMVQSAAFSACAQAPCTYQFALSPRSRSKRANTSFICTSERNVPYLRYAPSPPISTFAVPVGRPWTMGVSTPAVRAFSRISITSSSVGAP